jgi:hypothetical protein
VFVVVIGVGKSDVSRRGLEGQTRVWLKCELETTQGERQRAVLETGIVENRNEAKISEVSKVSKL